MSSESEVSVHYQVDRRDVIEQMVLLMLPTIIRVLLVLLVLGGIALFFLGENRWIAVAIAIFPLIFVFFVNHMAGKIVAEHPELLDQQTLTYDEQEIRIANSVTRIAWPWSRIRSVVDKDKFVVLRFDSLGSGAVIPKSALSGEQLSEILARARGAA